MYAKLLKKIVGITLIALGVVGLFLPILQGVLLILAGLFMLEVTKEQIKAWIKKIKF